MTDFKVVANELDSAAGQFKDLSSSATGLIGSLSGIALGPTDFGRLPGQGGMYAAYRGNVTKCKDTLKEAASSFNSVSNGLTVTSKDYADMESKAINSIDKYFSRV